MYEFTGVQSHLTTRIALCDKVTEFVDEERAMYVFYLSSARLSRLFPTLFWYQGSGCCGLGEALTDGLGSEGVVILSG